MTTFLSIWQRTRVLTNKLPNFSKFFDLNLCHSCAHSFITDSLSESCSFIREWAETIATQVSTCTSLRQLNQIHAHIIQTQMLKLYNAPFYWNNIIRSYNDLGSSSNALQLYIAMHRHSVMPDHYTLPIVLKALSRILDLKMAQQVHNVAIKHGLGLHNYTESGFISVYCKTGDFESAHKVFDENPDRTLGSWNAILAGLLHGGRAKEALDVFIELKNNGFRPDDVTMVCVISACGSLGDLNLALQLHKYVFQAKNFKRPDILMHNSLIDMYGKCGRMDLAYRVFSRMDEQNESSWTSMIAGYAMHGQSSDAFECFRHMRKSNVRPNHITFTTLLSACVHGGALQEGKNYFKMMEEEYKLNPKLPHYGCMVDLLGRAGLLEEAKEMVEKMPMKANVIIFGCLMGACEKFGDVKMAEWVAKHLVELDPLNDGVYVVLSNIYACNGLWDEVEQVRKLLKQGRLEKVPGFSLATISSIHL